MIDDAKKRSFCLINGSFHPEDARLLLMTLVDDKINFHQRNDWSRRERFGESDPATIKRIEELRQTKLNIDQLMAEVGSIGKKLSISCNIEIVLEPD